MGILIRQPYGLPLISVRCWFHRYFQKPKPLPKNCPEGATAQSGTSRTWKRSQKRELKKTLPKGRQAVSSVGPNEDGEKAAAGMHTTSPSGAIAAAAQAWRMVAPVATRSTATARKSRRPAPAKLMASSSPWLARSTRHAETRTGFRRLGMRPKSRAFA